MTGIIRAIITAILLSSILCTKCADLNDKTLSQNEILRQGKRNLVGKTKTQHFLRNGKLYNKSKSQIFFKVFATIGLLSVLGFLLRQCIKSIKRKSSLRSRRLSNMIQCADYYEVNLEEEKFVVEKQVKAKASERVLSKKLKILLVTATIIGTLLVAFALSQVFNEVLQGKVDVTPVEEFEVNYDDYETTVTPTVTSDIPVISETTVTPTTVTPTVTSDIPVISETVTSAKDIPVISETTVTPTVTSAKDIPVIAEDDIPVIASPQDDDKIAKVAAGSQVVNDYLDGLIKNITANPNTFLKSADSAALQAAITKMENGYRGKMGDKAKHLSRNEIHAILEGLKETHNALIKWIISVMSNQPANATMPTGGI